VVWSGTLVLLVLLIGLSRLYLGAHYLTDVIAGYTAGTFWTVTVILAGHLLTIRRRRVAVPTNRG
jgi:undecaprenyl-diphosphatase